MKEEKEIDINNEKQILKECDFDYFYNSENCSREFCCFFNDITMQRSNFNKKSAIIDLGRIAITLNQQDKRIKELQENLSSVYDDTLEGLRLARDNLLKSYKENQQLKQQLAKKEEIIKEMEQEINDRDKHIDSLEEKNELLKRCEHGKK